MSDSTPAVTDDVAGSRFLYVEDGHEAQLVYEAEPGRLVLVHTEVPESLGGRGIAGRLVSAAVERAKAAKETVVPVCPYARRWLQEHADAAAGLTIDWGGAA